MCESLVFIRPAERRKLLTVALMKTFVWSSSKTLYFLYTYHRHLFLQHWLDPFKHDLDHYFKRETLMFIIGCQVQTAVLVEKKVTDN